MRRLGILFLLLAFAGGARAADPPTQKFVVFFQEWSAAMDETALSVVTQAADWAKTHPGEVVRVDGQVAAGRHAAMAATCDGPRSSAEDVRRDGHVRLAQQLPGEFLSPEPPRPARRRAHHVSMLRGRPHDVRGPSASSGSRARHAALLWRPRQVVATSTSRRRRLDRNVLSCRACLAHRNH